MRSPALSSPAVVLCAVVVLCATAAVAQQPAELEWRNGKWQPTTSPATDTPQGYLALVRRYLDTGRYGAAVAAADTFLKRYPDDPAGEEVMLIAGEAQLKRQLYFQAYERFEKLLEKYPSGQFTERVLSREFDIGRTFLAGAKRQVAGVLYVSAQDEGEEILLKVVEHAPGSVIAERAMMTVADYHFQNGHWDEAVKAYDRHVELFKNSPDAPRAMLQAAVASYASYRGPEYENVGLVEAQERMTLFKQRYPSQASQARTDDMLAQVDAQQAQKLWNTAEFYKRTGQPRAQAYYCRYIVQHLGNTGFAPRAKAALESLGPVEAPIPQRQPLKAPASPLRIAAPPAQPPPAALTQPAPELTPPGVEGAGQTTQPTTAPTSRSVESLAPTSQPTAPATNPTTQPTTDEVRKALLERIATQPATVVPAATQGDQPHWTPTTQEAQQIRQMIELLKAETQPTSQPADDAKPGIDLRGAHRASTKPAGDAAASEELIRILKARVQPTDLYKLEWRPAGNDRVEVIFPKAAGGTTAPATEPSSTGQSLSLIPRVKEQFSSSAWSQPVTQPSEKLVVLIHPAIIIQEEAEADAYPPE